MSPDTERALVELALARGLVSAAELQATAREGRRAVAQDRQGTLARRLVERGVLRRDVAVSLLREVRAARVRRGGVESTLVDPRRRAAPAPPAPAATPAAAPARPARGVAVLGPGVELGPYRLVAELGRGGMGVVFEAEDRRLGRVVAIKTISGFADAESTERFVREARAAARLRHPGVVQVLDAGTLQGVVFVALELVTGGSLQKRLEGGPLPPHEASALVRDLALAVHAAHEEGVLHRDLKPANVLLEVDGRPRLTDFGLALDVRAASLTETGVALGTPAYMAPEQADADKAAQGPWTDVYGLGAVLYHTLTGSAPFVGATGLAIMHRVLTQDVESPTRRRAARGLPPLARDLETICLKALEKRPVARYRSALELSEDLARSLRGEPIAARPPGPGERARRALRRHRVVATAAAVALTLVVGVVVVFGAREREAEARRRQEQRRQDEERTRQRDLERARASAELEDAEEELARARPADVPLARTGSEERRRRALVAGARALALGQVYLGLGADDARGRVEEVGRSLFPLALRSDELDLARLCLRYFESDAARAELERRTSEAAVARRARALQLLDRAAYLKVSGNLEASLRVVEDALLVDPEQVDALMLAANVLTAQGELDEAERAYDRALELDPRNPILLVSRGKLRLERGATAPAEADATRALELEPAAPAALRLRVEARLARGALELALVDACAAVDAAPWVAENQVVLARILIELQRHSEALEVLDEAVRLAPERADAHGLRGMILGGLRRFDEARRALTRALELRPDDPVFRRALAALGGR